MLLRLLLALCGLLTPAAALRSAQSTLAFPSPTPALPLPLLAITLITPPLFSPLPLCTLHLRVLHPSPFPLPPCWRDLLSLPTPALHFLHPLSPSHLSLRHQAFLTCPPPLPPSPSPPHPPLCVWPPHGLFFTPTSSSSTPSSSSALPLSFFVFPSSTPCVDPREWTRVEAVCAVDGEAERRVKAGNVSSAVRSGELPVCALQEGPGMRRPVRVGHGWGKAEGEEGRADRGRRRGRRWLAGLSVLMLCHAMAAMWAIARWTAKLERC